jgi:hypothetical protein
MKKAFYILSVSILFLFPTNAHAQVWSELGGNNALHANGTVLCVCSDPSGNIYAAGNFVNASGNYYVAKYNGSTWSELGGNNALAAFAEINCLYCDASGNVYAGGAFTNGSGNVYVAKFNGSAWSELGGPNSLSAHAQQQLLSITSDAAGNIYTSGYLMNGSGNYYVAKYNGTAWSELGGTNSLAANNLIDKVCTDTFGNVYTAGYFTNDSGNHYVAKYNGTTWSVLGGATGIISPSINGGIMSLCTDLAGHVYAGGSFSGPLQGYPLIWYNGTTWSELGGPGQVNAGLSPLALYSDALGNIYADGNFMRDSGINYVAVYNGTAWSKLGGTNVAPFIDNIEAICADPSGNVYAAGEFTNDSGNNYVARFGFTTAISEVAPAYSVKLYPNPNKGNFTLQFTDDVVRSVEITDAVGRTVVPAIKVSKQQIFNIEQLTDGVYILRVIENNSAQSLKFSVVR